MRVEVLYFDGCPSHEALMPRLRELMDDAHVDAPVELKQVDSIEEAQSERFLGSPTLRIDGRDVDPGAAQREDYGLKCRLYATGHGLRGEIPAELITAALTRGRQGAAGPRS
jgi:hypothetical protein